MRGYFGIGIYNMKSKVNLGTLWRSAYQLGASFIFTIGRRYELQKSDTYHTTRHIPLFQFCDFESFRSTIHDCQIILVEFDEKAHSIKDFGHPERAAYLLGAEDHGFPQEILESGYPMVMLPWIRRPSYNVAIAGSIVMFDRYQKNNS